MQSIYGWLSVSESNAPFSIIDRQRTAAKTDVAHKTSNHHANAALGGDGLHKAPSSYQSGRLLAIIEGSPHWTDSTLLTIAENHGHAQALAEGFLHYGKAILNYLRGAFALCVLEPDQHYAFLAIDRLGIRPLAFYSHNDLLVFGSTLDHIIAHPDVKGEIDPQGIYNYLYFHMVPSPGSIYKGMSKLQPAECIEFKHGQITRDFYWQLNHADSNYSKPKLLEQLQNQLLLSTTACKPNKNTGTFLSGGLDSSTVTGIYQKLSDHPIDAFSIGFDADGYDEMEFARATAKHFNVNLHEYYVTPEDVLAALPLIAQTYDEPFGNASAIPAYYCAKFAREHGMTQLLAGDGGDEIFAGNARYAKQKMFDLYRYIPGFAKHLLEPLAFNVPLLSKVKSYIEQANIPMPDRMETYNFLHRTPLAEIFSDDFLAQIDTDAPAKNLRNTYKRAPSSDLVKRMLFLDGKFTLADNDLRKVNRMCELAGIDVQYPMLQEDLVEFAASIPSKWLMDGFELRSFYREGMKDFLAKETLSKSKQGFGLPFGVWMSSHEPLRQFAEANLQGIAQRGILNPNYIDNLIKAQKEGHASYYGVMIWILISLEQWLVAHGH